MAGMSPQLKTATAQLHRSDSKRSGGSKAISRSELIGHCLSSGADQIQTALHHGHRDRHEMGFGHTAPFAVNYQQV